MSDAIEIGTRLVVALTIFGVMALWETVRGCRPLQLARGRRWLANLGLALLNTAILRLLFPTAAVGAALLAEERQWGLLRLVELPPPVTVALGVILLDLVIYLQHVLFHVLPVLWRLHKVHHADHDFDVTTGIRFHPLEIVLSMFLKLAAVTSLGASPLSVLLFETLLNGTSLFNHGNVSLPPRLDAVLRWLVVTPDMHRVHHSVEITECNSNFGFNLPWWDRLLGTYRQEALGGSRGMTIGLRELGPPRPQSLPWMLWLPFVPRTPPPPGS